MIKKTTKNVLLLIFASMALMFSSCKGLEDPIEELEETVEQLLEEESDEETSGKDESSKDESSEDESKKDDTKDSDADDDSSDADDGDSDDGDQNNPDGDDSNGGNQTDYTSFLLPAIRIQTTNPKDPTHPLAFVTEPIAETVKIHSTTGGNTWGFDNLSKPSPWYEDCTISVESASGVFDLENVTGKVKARGNYTTTYPKKGLRIKFNDKQKMFGLHGGKKFKNWVLLAEYKDFSMVRDFTAINLWHAMTEDYYGTECKFVEVYLNDEYWGVYLLVEQQEDKRINDFTEPTENDDIVDTGYLMEFDAYAGIIENQFLPDENGGSYMVEQDFFKMEDYGEFYDINNEPVTGLNQYYTLKTDYDDAKKARIKGYMDNLWEICREAVVNHTYKEFNSDNTGIQDFTPTGTTESEKVLECVSKVIDIDSLVITVIQQEVACDLDLNWSSFYMDVDLNPASLKKLTFEAPWDFDSSFGNHRERQIGANGISHLCSVSAVEPCRGNPWTILFAGQDWYQEKIRAKWAEMNSANVKGQLINKINEISNDPTYIAAFNRNYAKWQNIGKPIGEELAPACEACTTQKQAAGIVTSFLNQRWSMLDNDFADFTSSYDPYKCRKVFNWTDNDGNKQTYTETIEVEAKDDGLHIKRIQDPRWEHVNIYVKNETTGEELPRIDSLPVSQEDFVYKYVTAEKTYSVWIASQDGDWKGWHSTQWDALATVKAKGGLGDVYIPRSDYDLNKNAKTISYSSYSPTNFDAVSINEDSLSYSLTLFNGQPWSDGVDPKYGASVTLSNNELTNYSYTGQTYTININEGDNYDWSNFTHGGAIIELTFREADYLYVYTIINGQLW